MNQDQVIQKTVLQRQQLSKTDECCLCIIARKGFELIDEQKELLAQGLIFRLTREDGCRLLRQYVEQGRKLLPENHLTLFDLDEPEEVLRTYFRTWSLSEAAELKLFELDPTGALAVEYSQYSAFDEKAEIKFMTLPNIVEDQKSYVARGPLSTMTRNKLLGDPIGEMFFRQELDLRRHFAPSTQVKMLSAHRAHEWMKRYTYYAALCEAAQMKLFEMKKPKKMVRLYESRHGLCNKARALAEKKGWL